MKSIARLTIFLAVLLAPPLAFGDSAKPAAEGIHQAIEGSRPATKIAFPKIADWNSLRIRLERMACFGSCPVYSVEIAGDGTVTYVGERFVAVTGRQTAKIGKQAVRKLYEAFAKCEFFWMFDSYEAQVTDLPTTRVSISFDSRQKTVSDYAGLRQGMPKAIAELEQAIDKAAGTAKWVKPPKGEPVSGEDKGLE